MSKPSEGISEARLCDSLSYQEALRDSKGGHPTVRRWASATVNAFCEIDRLKAALDAKQQELDAALEKVRDFQSALQSDDPKIAYLVNESIKRVMDENAALRQERDEWRASCETCERQLKVLEPRIAALEAALRDLLSKGPSQGTAELMAAVGRAQAALAPEET